MRFSPYPLKTCILLLCSLAACNTPSTEPVSTSVSEPEAPLFKRLSADSTGVNFSNQLPIIEQLNIINYEYFYNGGGVAIGDVNNDGLPDLYFTANLAPNKLYLNKGDMQFEDATRQAGVQGKATWATGVTMADVNQDGWLDIYVCRSGKFPGAGSRANELFINNGDGTFTDQAEAYGLADAGTATQAAFFDFDRDGDLDVFLLNHNTESLYGQAMLPLRYKRDEKTADRLYRNDGGTYTDISRQAGLQSNPLGYGLGVGIGDLNQDGWPDIYVCNDFVEQDYLYINDRKGGFVESLKAMTKHTSNFSMGNDLADYNNDGLTDIMVADMVAEDNYRQKTNMAAMSTEQFYQAVNNGFHYQYMVNTLQLNNGNGTFSEAAQLAGISNTDWSWATLMADYDLDGWKDLFVTNGFRLEHSNKDFINQRKQIGGDLDLNDPQQRMQHIKQLLPLLPTGKVNNYIYQNEGNLHFTKRSADWGMDIPSWSNGAAYGDLDLDGDLDLVVNNVDMAAFIYQNQAMETRGHHYLKVRFAGPNGNRNGIGAQVEILDEGRYQLYSHYLSRGYQSGVNPGIVLGLGRQSVIDRLRITWPDGKEQLLTGIKADQEIRVQYEEARLSAKAETTPAPLMVNHTPATDLIIRHRENDYDDLSREVLLPHKMSQWGPALAVADVDGDGLDDIFAGGAKGQAAVLVLQKADGSFAPSTSQPWSGQKQGEDVDALFFDPDQDGDPDLYIVRGGNEVAEGDPLLQDLLYLNNGEGRFRLAANWLPALPYSGGRVLTGDYDADGDADLFVTGRQQPGKYPLPGRSLLLRNEGTGFTEVTDSLAPDLARIGMVTDARWLDADADGLMDLALVGEWMPLTIAYQRESGFELWQQEGSTGWWFSLASADLDQDGDQDLIAGNLGLNYKYKASAEEPFEIYAGDFDDNGKLDIVLGYYNSGELYPLRGRQCSAEQVNQIKEQFPTYADFGNATLEQVYGDNLMEALHYKAQTFASGIFYNQGDGSFEQQPFTNRAQLSSINAILLEDVDRDGVDDLLMAGNLFVSEPETPRNDAGMGALLLAKGNGQFDWQDPRHSGFAAGGDVRQLKPINLADGSRGVLVANNNHFMQLFRLSAK